MKILFFILFSFISQLGFSQLNTIIRVGTDYCLNFYSPYTFEKTVDIPSQYEQKSLTILSNIDFLVFKKNNISIYSGVSYKFINYKKIDVAKTINSPFGVTHTYDDPADLVSKSHSLGLSFEFEYKIYKKEHSSFTVGLKPTIYFFELYHSYYYSKDNLNDNYTVIKPLVTELTNNLFISSINSVLNLKWNYLPKESRFVFTGKLSLGANIYSDWEQFKRYAWLGVGLEIGFLGKEK